MQDLSPRYRRCFAPTRKLMQFRGESALIKKDPSGSVFITGKLGKNNELEIDRVHTRTSN